MSRALANSLLTLKNWVLKSNSRIQKLADGHGVLGTRAAPTQSGNNDKKIGSRLDNGETVIQDGKAFKRYKFQVNKGAEDPTLKALADKDSHKTWAEGEIPLEADKDPREVVENLFDELLKDLDKKS